jgi:hypothetical protein
MVAIVVGSLALGSLGIAGKPERDKAAELKPTVEANAAKIKAACGCEVAVDVKWDSYTKADDMRRITEDLNEVVGAATSQCNSPDNKTAMCKNVKTIEVSFANPVTAPEMKGTTLVTHSNGSSYAGKAQLKKILDKL